ncbi:hypothetical protein [Streptomyces sp. AM6-12]|uniref:hypothetical protein n=1 Tax=Streptomyces sp. AM6-12 TaxID=3345149 RepID=UPI0037B2BEB0
MTTHQNHVSAGCIADAAAPITAALAAVGDLDINVPAADVLISYTARGCIVRVADRRAQHQEAVERAFWDAFIAAGWGVARRQPAVFGLSIRPA